MKTFALSLAARKGKLMVHKAHIVQTYDDVDAHTWGVIVARALWSPDVGYDTHTCDVLEFEQERSNG